MKITIAYIFRYWTHVVNCSSCNMAYKGLNALEVVLQVVAVASIGIVAVAKQGFLSAPLRITLVSMAVLCFIASRWLSHFIYKNFHFHDYNHAFRWGFQWLRGENIQYNSYLYDAFNYMSLRYERDKKIVAFVHTFRFWGYHN